MAEHGYHEEEALGRAYDARLMRRLLGYLKAYKGKVALATLLGLAQAGCEIFQPWLVKIAIDGDIARGDFAGLTQVAMLYLCVLGAEFVVTYFPASIMQAPTSSASADARAIALAGSPSAPTSGRIVAAIIGPNDESGPRTRIRDGPNTA